MAGMSKAIIIGNLGRDPEMRYTPAGLAVANFTLAATEKFKGEERTEWHRIVVFGKLAEICGEYLSKGKQVFIEGRIQTRDWEDKEGNKRTTTEIIASDMVMLGSRQDGGGSKNQRGNGYQGQGESGGQRQGYSGQNQGNPDSHQGQGSSGSYPEPSGRPPGDDIPF
ncbi:MAG: single-stranded DNA-binding protein [Proteobacteria bacterium]|nr:single-stranded DNA-binding protein [Pseudomonadota bacterium]